jgi:prepilin-type processing-associated H-X9-DG protein
MTDLNNPELSRFFVLINEHPDSINGARFAARMLESDRMHEARIIDYPASYHNGSGTLSFADGHSEFRKWIDSCTTPPVRYNNQLQLNKNCREQGHLHLSVGRHSVTHERESLVK